MYGLFGAEIIRKKMPVKCLTCLTILGQIYYRRDTWCGPHGRKEKKTKKTYALSNYRHSQGAGQRIYTPYISGCAQGDLASPIDQCASSFASVRAQVHRGCTACVLLVTGRDQRTGLNDTPRVYLHTTVPPSPSPRGQLQEASVFGYMTPEHVRFTLVTGPNRVYTT